MGGLLLMLYTMPKLSINLTPQILTTSYSTIFNYNGAGYLNSFELDFSNTGWQIRVLVDNIECFDVNCSELSNFTFHNADLAMQLKGNFVLQNSGKDIYYNAVCDMNHNTTLTIQAKRVTGIANCSRTLVYHCRELTL